VRAIAAAPPGQYANIPIAGADPSKPPSALAQSLRLALKLLSQDSPQGSRFRARLLLALASPNEKDSASGSVDPTKALSSSIDAQIFGMHGPPEEELAPFFALTSPVSNKSPISPMRPLGAEGDVGATGAGTDEDQATNPSASTMTIFNFEDHLGPGLAPNLGVVNSASSCGLGASTGLGSAGSCVTGLGGSSSSTSLAQTPGGLLSSTRPVSSAWALGAESDPSLTSFESAALNAAVAQELDSGPLVTGARRLGNVHGGGTQASPEGSGKPPEGDLDATALGNECDDGRASEDGGIASASARESEGEPAVSMRGSEASTQPPSDPAWDSVTNTSPTVRQQPEVVEGGFAAAAAAAVAAGSSGTGSSNTTSHIRGGLQAAFHGVGQPISLSRRHSLKEVHLQSQPQSPPRRARRVLPTWIDLKDQQSREPSAQPEGRARSPHSTAKHRSTHSPGRGAGGGSNARSDNVGSPVAWCSPSVSPPREGARESPLQRRSATHSRSRRPGVAGHDDRVHRSAEDMHKPVAVMPLRLKNLSPNRISGLGSIGTGGGSPKDVAKSPQASPRAARNGSPTHSVYYRGMTAPPLAPSGSPSPGSREAGGARTPGPSRPNSGSGPMVDRQGSTLRLRRDREGCQRAIAAQFQGQNQEERRNSKDHSPSPTRARPNIDFYAVGKLIGKGAFGKVNVGVHKLTEELTAMKLCERRRIAEVSARKCLMQEVSILRRLNGHPNMIQLFEVIETTTHIVLVLEFAAGGDLLRYVRQRRRLAEDNAQELFKQLADGIGHIHNQCVVHRDVKLENLLLDSFGCLKIADFGVAVVVKPPGRRLTEHCGTPSYIAPEILLEAGYEGQPVDVWSCGVVLYAMLCGRVPFKGEHLSELKRCIVKGRFHLPNHLSDSAASMLKGMLVVDPRKRFTLREVVTHAWMESVANRAELVYGQTAPVYPPEAGRPEGARALPNDDNTKELLKRVAEFGFPQAFIEESLQEGKLNHATATFHLLAQQAIRKRVKVTTLAPSSPVAGGVATADDAPNDDLN